MEWLIKNERGTAKGVKVGNRFYVRKDDGSLDWHENPPLPHQHTTRTVDDFVEATGRLYLQQPNVPDDGKSLAVFVGQDTVVAVLDVTGHRDDVITLPLTVTPQFKRLAGLDACPVMHDQKQFVHLLEFELFPLVLPDVVAAFRAVRVRSDEDKATSLKPSATGISLSVRKEVMANGADLPERLQLQLRVFEESPEDPGESPVVRCAIGCDLDDEKFWLRPLPGDIRKAVDAALGHFQVSIVEALERESLESALVVLGSPG